MNLPGFVGPSYVTRLPQVSAEECINLYADSLESPNAKQAVLRRVPGLSVAISGMRGPIRGQFQQDVRSFAVGGDTLYETTTGSAVSRGTVVNDSRPVSFSTNGSQGGAGGHQIFLVSGGYGYIFDLSANTLTLITSAGFPSGSALMGAYFDGYFLVLTATAVQQSALEDGTTWNGAAKASRSIASDNNAAIIVNYPQHSAWVFGSLRTEVWYDNGGAVFSFGPIPGVFVNVGCAAPASVCRYNNTIAWLGTDELGTRVVYEANQYTPQRISTTAVEYDLAQFSDVSDFVGYAYQEEGHTFYVLTSVRNARTWVYDAKEQLWHKRGYWNSTTATYGCVRGWNHIVSPTGAHWVGDYLSGTIYAQSLAYYDDAGNSQRWLRRFPHLSQQQHRITYPGFALDAQKGIGLSTGQGSDPQVMLRWSDTGGETWSNEYWRSLGKQGKFAQRTIWTRLGTGRNRVFEVSGSDAIPLALTGAYLDPDPVIGSN